MDFEGLEKALKVTADKREKSSCERVETVEADFLLQAQRLGHLAEANYEGPLLMHGINIADLPASSFGAGRLSAMVMKMRIEDERSHLFRVDFFFTPGAGQYGKPKADFRVRLASETFTDVHRGNSVFPHRYDSAVSAADVLAVESFVVPQVEAMSSTIDMLEEALFTENLGNEVVLARFEEIERRVA